MSWNVRSELGFVEGLEDFRRELGFFSWGIVSVFLEGGVKG